MLSASNLQADRWGCHRRRPAHATWGEVCARRSTSCKSATSFKMSPEQREVKGKELQLSQICMKHLVSKEF